MSKSHRAALKNAETFCRVYLTDANGQPCKIKDFDVGAVVPIMVTVDMLNSIPWLVEIAKGRKAK